MKFGLHWLKRGDEVERLLKVLPELEKLAEILPKIEKLADDAEKISALLEYRKSLELLDENATALLELAAKYKTQKGKVEQKAESEVKKSTFIRAFKPHP